MPGKISCSRSRHDRWSRLLVEVGLDRNSTSVFPVACRRVYVLPNRSERGRADWFCLSCVATCQEYKFRGASHWSSLKPFLVRAYETPSTDSVHERSSPFLHSATVVAKGRARRFPLYDRKPVRPPFDIETPKDDCQLPGHCGNRFLCDSHPA